MHSCGFYGMAVFFYWKSFWWVLLWPLHSFVCSSNRSKSKEMIKDGQGWSWSLWACIGGNVALIWQNSLDMVDWFVSHSTIRVDPKYKRLSWTQVGFVVIRSDNCITCNNWWAKVVCHDCWCKLGMSRDEVVMTKGNMVLTRITRMVSTTVGVGTFQNQRLPLLSRD